MTTETGPAHVAAALALAEAGIPMDVQELLLRGDPMRGIKPSVLFSAISAYLKAMGSEPVAWLVKRFDPQGAWMQTDAVLVKPQIASGSATEIAPLFSAPPAPARDEEIERLTRERDELQQRLLTAYAVKAECNDEANFQRHRAIQAEDILAKSANGSRPLPYDREDLGRFVREAWVRWAATQPNPKPSWLVPYEELSEPDKEADRQIGEAVARWTLIGASAEAALQSERAGSGDAVRVKPLRFEAQDVDKTLYVSEVSITGEYHVTHVGSSWEVSVRGYVVAREQTSEKAINAAQARHADVVRSALTVDTDRPATGKEGELIRDLRDALENLLGIYDSPLSRRRFPQDEFMREAIETARATLRSSKGE